MAGIKQPILDILTKLSEIPDFLFIRIWNNQIQAKRDGRHYDYPTPAAFVEVINDPVYEQLGLGFQSSDVGFRVHIEHTYYDAQDGTFEQDLPVFDLRDKVVAKLSLFEPTACGPLTRVSETQDYDHDNIYHYIIDFTCSFIDSKGSPYDTDAGKYIEKEPPTGLQVDVNVVTSIEGQENVPVHNYQFKIPQ